jgi:signal transduction histidine kinase/ActR/RegA family two-component response regulator
MTHEESPSADAAGRLQRCIRDLAAVQALPSMCIGRSPDEALRIVFDALPTVLGADLVYLELPGTPAVERAWIRGRHLEAEEIVSLRSALTDDGSTGGSLSPLPQFGEFHWFEATVPVGAGRGRLVAGRGVPLDPATDRVLVRCAANLVGTTLENANVLEAARRKDEFMAMLGHELRNPLAPILTAVELLARHPEAAREQQVIGRNTRHLARLVDDLLDISRVTRGHVALRSEDVPLASVLDRAVEVAAPLVTRQRHQLRVDDASGIQLRGDPVRLVQVFGNLLTNAVKFTPPGGRIDVSIARLPDRVRVSVHDNGRGIAHEHLARIFEPFVQIDRQSDAMRGGLGLGLAIVHDLVNRHGGTIEVKSDGPQRGTIFTVELPAVFAKAREDAAAAPAPAQTPRGSFRVLIVDDNTDVASLLAEALHFAGYDTTAENDARSALRTWRRFAPHAGVFDVGLPDLDGYDLAREVRAEHGPKPMLIAATGYGQPQDKLRAVASGFDLHLVKPVSVEELVTVLDSRVAAAARTG